MSSSIKLIKELKKYVKNIKTLKEAKKVAMLLDEDFNIDLEEIVEILDRGYESDKENEEIMTVIEESNLDDSESEREDSSLEELQDRMFPISDKPIGEQELQQVEDLSRRLEGLGKYSGDNDTKLRDSVKFIMSVKSLGNYVDNKVRGKGKEKKKWELHAVMLMKPLRKNSINKVLREYGLEDKAKGRKIEDFPNRYHINILNKRLFGKYRSKKIDERVNLVYGKRK